MIISLYLGMRKILVLCICAVFMFGCNNQIVLENGDDDLKKADSLSRMFYEKVREKNYPYLIKIFKDKQNKKQLLDLFKFKDSILGNIEYVSSQTAYSKNVIKKDSNTTDYFISTKVVFENGSKANEDIEFEKLNDTTYLTFYNFTITNFGHNNK